MDFKYRDGRPGTRVTYGITSFKSDASCAGHGTHVAGIVGGLKYGVAKDVDIVMGKLLHLFITSHISIELLLIKESS